jgi:hypothetical protein
MVWMMRGIGSLWIFNVIPLFHGSTSLTEIWDTFMVMQPVMKAGLVAVAFVIFSVIRSSIVDIWTAVEPHLSGVRWFRNRLCQRQPVSDGRPAATMLSFSRGKRGGTERPEVCANHLCPHRQHAVGN